MSFDPKFTDDYDEQEEYKPQPVIHRPRDAFSFFNVAGILIIALAAFALVFFLRGLPTPI